LYDFAATHGVGHRRLGKLIVATDEAQIQRLRDIETMARANDVNDVTLIDGAEAMRMEPALSAVAALVSPSTGIIDSHGLMLALEGDAAAAGTAFAFHSPVASGRIAGDRIKLDVGGAEPVTLAAHWVINCAGHGAQELAARIDGLSRQTIPAGAKVKGSYFSLSGSAPFSRLIYPLPSATRLGIHLALDLSGRARFGPDAEPVETLDYRVDPARAPSFYTAIRQYWPSLPDDALHPDYSGIRPVLNGVGGPKVDFVIQGPKEHGVKGLINLYGIESPGLTASLAIAEEVVTAVA